ncbi:ribosome maturation factor RimP [Aliikangiella marina]|uniref:Ribosome maturation factor RimP n=1 Tax=Aliikangiella marina TaxID=1712262 RepID=A0A545TC95_9GAMM|nr:ribosome maturation factor RimP [Aliikangiella marina]TQV74834.1 ribosome maturation factor RimP [Aliikangiella marina]
MAKVDQLSDMLRPAAEALGYEFLGVEYIGQGKHTILRIYIDHENGINVDDCASVSHQVSGILEVEDPISSQYTLEVSSPGMDRPLFTMAHFSDYVGQEVQIRCHVGVDGRRKFKGKLVSATDETLVVEVDNETFDIDFQDVDKANLVPVFD